MTGSSWAAQWRALLLTPDDPRAAREVVQGRAHHRSGRVTDLRVSTGALWGRVQGHRATPRTVDVAVAVLGDGEWRRVVELLAGQLRHSARLLAGLQPEGLVEELAEGGVQLLPAPEDVETTCGCGRPQPCAHAAAVWEAATDRIDADPFTLLRLRGRGRERLLAELAADRAEPGGETPFRPVSELPVEGWSRARSPLEELHLPVGEVGAAALPLRLLGNPPGWPGGPDADDLFDPLVDRAAEWARRLDDEDF